MMTTMAADTKTAKWQLLSRQSPPRLCNQYSTLVRSAQDLTKELRQITQMSGRARRNTNVCAIILMTVPACRQSPRFPLPGDWLFMGHPLTLS